MVLKVFFSWQEETNPQGVNNKLLVSDKKLS